MKSEHHSFVQLTELTAAKWHRGSVGKNPTKSEMFIFLRRFKVTLDKAIK